MNILGESSYAVTSTIEARHDRALSQRKFIHSEVLINPSRMHTRLRSVETVRRGGYEHSPRKFIHIVVSTDLSLSHAWERASCLDST